jgi:beta-glucosidase
LICPPFNHIIKTHPCRSTSGSRICSARNIGEGDLLPRAGGAYAPGPYYTPHITPLAGLRNALGDGVEIQYAQGCEVLGEDRSGFDRAVQAAQRADVAIVVVAGKSGLQRLVTVGEGNDAANLELTGVQHEFVEVVAGTGTPLVVEVLSGRVHTLMRVAARANALIRLFPPGEEGGNGLADVLTGAVNPSGRLPVTLPRMVGQVPIYHGYRAGGGRPMFFDDYTDCPPTPLFAFGHGLSYTSFAYADFAVRALTTTDPIEIAVEICNTGQRAGDEIVQLYGRDNVASVAQPDQLLLGFARVPLDPCHAKRVTFTVHPSRLAFCDPAVMAHGRSAERDGEDWRR